MCFSVSESSNISRVGGISSCGAFSRHLQLTKSSLSSRRTVYGWRLTLKANNLPIFNTFLLSAIINYLSSFFLFPSLYLLFVVVFNFYFSCCSCTRYSGVSYIFNISSQIISNQESYSFLQFIMPF